MDAKPYAELSDLELLELAAWREARGESFEGKRAVVWSIQNRVHQPKWWGKDWRGVILKPWQYSSFNVNDPNVGKWPAEDDPSFIDCCKAAEPIYSGQDTQDPTDGATHYYDTSINFPKAWGSQSGWVNTLNIGRLKFWKEAPPAIFLDAQDN